MHVYDLNLLLKIPPNHPCISYSPSALNLNPCPILYSMILYVGKNIKQLNPWKIAPQECVSENW